MELRGWGVVLFVAQALLAVFGGVVVSFGSSFAVGYGYHAMEWHGPVSPTSGAERRDTEVAGDVGFVLGFDAVFFVQLLATVAVVQGFRASRASRKRGLAYDDAPLGDIVVEYVFALTLVELAGLLVWCATFSPHLPRVLGGLAGTLISGAVALFGLVASVKRSGARSLLFVRFALVALAGLSLVAGLQEANLFWRPSLLGSLLGLLLLQLGSSRPEPASPF